MAVAGDRIVLQNAPTGTPANAAHDHSVTFLATTTGEFVLPYSSNAALSTLAADYFWITGTNDASSATETARDDLAQAMSITKLYVNLAGSPGAGKSYTFALRQNAGATSPVLSCAVAEAATSCNDTDTVTINNDDLLDNESTPAGTPTARAPQSVSYLAQIAAGATRRLWLIQ